MAAASASADAYSFFTAAAAAFKWPQRKNYDGKKRHRELDHAAQHSSIRRQECVAAVNRAINESIEGPSFEIEDTEERTLNVSRRRCRNLVIPARLSSSSKPLPLILAHED